MNEKKLYSLMFYIENPVWVNKPSFFDPYYDEYSHTEYIGHLLPALDGDYKPEVLFECEPSEVTKVAAEHAKSYWNYNWCDENGNDPHEDACIYDWDVIEVRVFEDLYEDGASAGEYYEWYDEGMNIWVPFEW